MPTTNLATAPLGALALLVPLTLGGCAFFSDDDDGGLGRGRVALVQYPTCAALESDLKARALAELEVILDNFETWGGGGGGLEDPSAGEGDDDAGGFDGYGDDRGEGEDFSGTNNQEDGVDEADLVKTDGHHIYTVDGSGLHAFAVPEFGQLAAGAVTPVEGTATELLLDTERRRAAVFSMVYAEQLPEGHPLRAELTLDDTVENYDWRSTALSKITIFDLSDPLAPTVARELWFEGWYQTARRHDASVRAVVNGYLPIPGLDDWWSYAYDEQGEPRPVDEIRAQATARIQAIDLEDLIPRYYVRTPSGGFASGSLAGTNCTSFYAPTDSMARGMTSIVSLDLTSDVAPVDADTVVANWATVYASTDRLYLAEWAWPEWSLYASAAPGAIVQPSTNLHAFDVSQPGRAAYVGSGRIDGTVVNQFALDEEEGLLRVAATTTPWRVWDGADEIPEAPPAPESHVYVLSETDAGLVTIGQLDGIAPGEQIYSARFVGDRGYVVTFEQIDPLFTIDLSAPMAPVLVGELEVFGFSTYLHPLGDDRLLAMGVGGDEDGANWRSQVSLFDTSDFAAPGLLDTHVLDTQGWGWSEALYEHRAFTYFGPKKMLAVPMSGYSETSGNWISRLELIDVGDAALSSHGAIDHSSYFDADDPWWSSADIRRSIFMGDYVYSLSARALTVHRLADLQPITAVELPAPPAPYWYCGGGLEGDVACDY